MGPAYLMYSLHELAKAMGSEMGAIWLYLMHLQLWRRMAVFFLFMVYMRAREDSALLWHV
jgi:hypothetical protein